MRPCPGVLVDREGARGCAARPPAGQDPLTRRLISVARRTEFSNMTVRWPALNYSQWSATCDTLHAHTQVLGKLAAVLAPPEPQFQHTALELTARGWETAPLPAADGR